jgi:SMODS-associating 2TM, beta-strand rich effector domain
MEKDYFRYYKPKMLLYTIITLSLFYGTILHFASDYINGFFAKPYVHYPTVSALIVLTLLIINKYGINTKLLKKMFWVKDLSGRYEGKIKYEHFKTGIEEEKPCFLEIEQSASKISIQIYFDFKYTQTSEKTTSKSIVTSIVSDDFDNQQLVFTYHNLGNPIKGLQPSNGTNILSILERNNSFFLEGIYYTNKEPQTKGELKVKFISKKLKREF